MHDFRDFYVSGGTLRADAPSYMERRADAELYHTLRRSEFCYVLTPRQMGKSSLMVRVARRLRKEGARVAVLDLTVLGSNVSPEQWYLGLLTLLGDQLDRYDDVRQLWEQSPELGPLQRFTAALTELLQSEASQNHDRVQDELSTSDFPTLVIFLDEIDAVRSLPFRTDEFFASIRALFNRRASHANYRRLAVCLLGVATPADLIRETRNTPFNIGRRIELQDFSLHEAQPLARGLAAEPRISADAAICLLERIYHWTAGHPYLTQKLCLATAEALSEGRSTLSRRQQTQLVDQVCARVFFSSGSLQRDDSLLFVQQCMLRSGPELVCDDAELSARLDRYQRVLTDERRGPKGKLISGPSDPIVARLRLSGIVRGEAGELRPRNRIYARVFNQKWARSQMPDAELRRQRQAYFRGALRATLLAGVLLAIMAALVAYAFNREQDARLASKEKDRALVREAEALRRSEAALIKAQQAQARADLAAVDASASESREKDARNRATEQARLTQHEIARIHVAEGMRSAEEGDPFAALHRFVQALRVEEKDPHRARAHRLRLGSVLDTCPRLVQLWHSADQNLSAAFHPDGIRIAVTHGRYSVILLHSDTGSLAVPEMRHPTPISQVLFSPDGRRLLVRSVSGWIYLRDPDSGRLVAPRFRPGTGMGTACFSADGKWIAAADVEGTARVWSAVDGRPKSPAIRQPYPIGHLDLNHDGSRLATTSGKSVQLWDTTTGKSSIPPMRHNETVMRVHFMGPEGHLATSDGNRVFIWSQSSGQAIDTLHVQGVIDVVPNRISNRLLIRQQIEGVHIWQTGANHSERPLGKNDRRLVSAGLNGNADEGFTITEEGTLSVWSLDTGAPVRSSIRVAGRLKKAWISPDQRFLFTASYEEELRLWDLSPAQSVPKAVLPPGRVLPLDPGSDRVLVVPQRGNSGRFVLSTGLQLGPKFSAPANTVAAAESRDRRLFAAGALDGTVRVWDGRTGRPLSKAMRFPDAIDSLRFHPDGKSLLVAYRPHMLDLCLLSDWSFGPPITAPHLTHLTFSRNGEFLMVAGDSRLLLSRTTRSADTFPHLFGRDANSAAAFSPDGTHVLLGSPSGKAEQLLAANGKNSGMLVQHTAGVRFVGYRPDGLVAVTTCDDGSARLWDTRTGTALTTLLAHGEPVCHAAFNRKGDQLATLTDSGMARVWAVPSGELLMVPRKMGDGRDGQVAFNAVGDTITALFPTGLASSWKLRHCNLSVEQLERVSEQLAGYRYDSTQGAVHTIQKRKGFPGMSLHQQFTRLPAVPKENLAWHSAQAEVARSGKAWKTMVQHLTPLLKAQPDSSSLLERRAEAYAELGDWTHAADDYNAALIYGNLGYVTWYRCALARLINRDFPGYRLLCTRMLELFGPGADPPRDITAWTCALGPAAQPDVLKAIQWMESLTQKKPNDSSLLETLGALQFRAGRVQESRALLGRAAEMDAASGSSVTFYFLAMCEARLGNVGAARQALQSGIHRTQRDGIQDRDWDEKLERSLLRTEAEAAVARAAFPAAQVN